MPRYNINSWSKWSDADISTLKEMRELGYSARDISNKLGKSINAIKAIVTRLSLPQVRKDLVNLNMRSVWTTDLLDELRTLAKHGYTKEEASSYFRVSYSTIEGVARHYKIKFRKKNAKVVGIDVSDFSRMWNDGYKISDIAAYFGISKHTVIDITKRLKLPRRLHKTSIYSQSLRDEVYELARAGFTNKDISEYTRIPIATVRNMISLKSSLYMRSHVRFWTPEKFKELRLLLDEKYSKKDIAKYFNVTMSSLYKAIYKLRGTL